ncbi:NifB/NifX family molybdenum-iron cluster-binding protein [Clostridium sp. HCP1S3_B4]|uniref:NifB/NifX family molybdenum-iron cluster-binding protein n=1 Tax=unclassified Clostridium TaxID=2614128 RepID=UPI003F8CD99C
MARPDKIKNICKMPQYTEFNAINSKICNTSLVLSIDEYEVLRLIDYNGLTQEMCAKQMAVSRASIQSIYNNARKKISRFIIEGLPLKIYGGNVSICKSHCSNKCFFNNSSIQICNSSDKLNIKEGNNMKIAVTYENGQIFQHFGHTEQFKIYNVEKGKITNTEIINTDGKGHGALGSFLKNQNVEILICGGIGGGAQNALTSCGIKFYGGATGNADENVQSFLNGNLLYNPNVTCSHHEEGHHCKSNANLNCGGNCNN